MYLRRFLVARTFSTCSPSPRWAGRIGILRFDTALLMSERRSCDITTSAMSSHQVLLSPLDQLMYPVYVPMFLIIPTDDPKKAVQFLNRGLQKTCEQMPYLKGSIYRSDGKGYLGITWKDNDPSLRLKEVIAPELPPYAQLEAQGMPAQYFHPGLCPRPLLGDPGKGKTPVMEIGYSTLRGGLLITSCFHHAAMDGTGQGVFFGRWAENSRSEQHTSPKPDPNELLNRGARLKRALPELPPKEVEDLPHFDQAVASDTDAAAPRPRVPTASEIFVFSRNKLDALRSAVSYGPVLRHKPPSLNTILSTLIWNRITRIRLLRLQRSPPTADSPAKNRSTLMMAADGRKHVFPSSSLKSEPYIGNIVLSSQTTSTFADLTCSSSPPAQIPYRPYEQPHSLLSYPSNLHSIISAVVSSANQQLSPHFVATILAIIDATPDVRNLQSKMDNLFAGNGKSLKVSHTHNLSLNVSTPQCLQTQSRTHPLTTLLPSDVLQSSWATLPAYQDFGRDVGSVKWFRTLSNDVDGLIVPIPRKRTLEGAEERIEVLVGLRTDDLEALRKDECIACWFAKGAGDVREGWKGPLLELGPEGVANGPSKLSSRL